MKTNRWLRKRSLFLLTCLAGSASYFLFDGIEQQPFATSSPILAGEEADYYSQHITFQQFSASGTLQQTLVSATSEHFPSAQITQFTQPFITTTSSDGKLWQIQALHGSLQDKEQLVVLTEQVEIQPQAPAVGEELLIKTSLLRYHTDNQLAETDQPVAITSANANITAIGMRLQVPDETLKLNQQVNTRYAPPSPH